MRQGIKEKEEEKKVGGKSENNSQRVLGVCSAGCRTEEPIFLWTFSYTPAHVVGHEHFLSQIFILVLTSWAS